jgi:hypothetical protein
MDIQNDTNMEATMELAGGQTYTEMKSKWIHWEPKHPKEFDRLE